MKTRQILFVLSACCILSACSPSKFDKSASSDSKVYQRNAFQSEAKVLAETGRFEEALEKYRQAIQPENVNYDYEMGVSKISIVNILKVLGRYDEALEEQQWFLRSGDQNQRALENRDEILSLAEYAKFGNKDKSLAHVESLKSKYASQLPPVGYDVFDAPLMIVKILMIYDAIGECDSAINYINLILNYLYTTHPEFARVESSDAAYDASKKTETVHDRKSRRGYEIIGEYLLVREAFEQDKKEGARGRASKALIQSRYFPW